MYNISVYFLVSQCTTYANITAIIKLLRFDAKEQS